MNVVLKNITKKFGEHVALDNISFDIQEGTLTSLLGPSGCGKTTLLRIISGLEHSNQGRVLVDSVDVTNTQLQRRKMGFVFQHYALFKHMNIFENVAFGLKVIPKKNRLSKEAIEERVHEVLSLVQLDNQSKKYPHQLSGGQQQRIALARVLAIHPKILLLDEPFGAIDATVRRHLRRWLRKLHEEIHITTVLVTHDQEEALEVSDTVVLLNHGRVEQVGSPREIYKSPANAFVYEFLGAVNIFQGRIKNHNLVHFTTDHQETLIEDHEPMYVRSHEVHVYSAAQRKEGDLEGVIIRVSFVGVTVLLEVKVYLMREGTEDVKEACVIEATTSDSYWEEHKFSQGDIVYVRISNVTVFPSKEL